MTPSDNGGALATAYAQGVGARSDDTAQLLKANSVDVLIEGNYQATDPNERPTRQYLGIEGDFFMIAQDVSFGPVLVRFNAGPRDTTSGQGWIPMMPGDVYRGRYKGVMVTCAGGSSFARIVYGYASDVRPVKAEIESYDAGGSGAYQSDNTAHVELALSGDFTGTNAILMTALTAGQFAVTRGAYRGAGILRGTVSVKTVVPTASYTQIPVHYGQLFRSAGTYSKNIAMRCLAMTVRESGTNTIVEQVYDAPRVFIAAPNTTVSLLLRSTAPYFAAVSSSPVQALVTLLMVR